MTKIEYEKFTDEELIEDLRNKETKGRVTNIKKFILKRFCITRHDYLDISSKFLIYMIKNNVKNTEINYCRFDDENERLIFPLNKDNTWEEVSSFHKKICFNKKFGSKLADNVLVNHFDGFDNINDIWYYYNKKEKCIICGKELFYIKFYRKIKAKLCFNECHSKLKSYRMKTGMNPRKILSKEDWEKIHKKQSVNMKQKILEGKWTPCVTNSWCKSRTVVDNIPFRSSWEAYFYIYKKYIDNENVEFEKLRISYFDEITNKNRIYIVDFIDYKNKIVYEIKPDSEKSSLTNISKNKELKKWSNENNYTCVYISDDWFNKNYYEDIVLDNFRKSESIINITRRLKRFNKLTKKVVSIEEYEYTGDTYNLHIENNHNYFANGYCISNCHGLKFENKMTDIVLQSNARFRIGLTGTLPDDEVSKMAILSCVGVPKRYIRTQGLIERGLATPVRINALIFKYRDTDKAIFKHVGNHAKRLKFIKEHNNRNDFIAKLAGNISLNGNTVVMCSHIQHMKDIFEKLVKLKDSSVKITEKDITGKNSFDFQKQYNIFYIAGATKVKDRELILDILKNFENVTIITGYALFSTGLNIKSLKNIIFASPLKSYTTISQSIGRAIRTHVSKDTAEIYDLVDDFSVRGNSGPFYNQYKERLIKSYNSEGFPVFERIIHL